MEGARSADDQEAVRMTHDDLDGIFSPLEDGLEGGISQRDFGYEQLGWDQRILAQNCMEEKCQSVLKRHRGIRGGVILRVSSTIAGAGSISRAGILRDRNQE